MKPLALITTYEEGKRHGTLSKEPLINSKLPLRDLKRTDSRRRLPLMVTPLATTATTKMGVSGRALRGIWLAQIFSLSLFGRPTHAFKQTPQPRNKPKARRSLELIRGSLNTFVHPCISLGNILTVILPIIVLEIITPGSNAAEWQSNTLLEVVRDYDEQEQRAHYDDLLAEFGQFKQLPKEFELQALLALSHYPELKQAKIKFIVADVSIPLSSRPHWSSMLRSAKNRNYQVIIDSELEGPRDVLLLKNQPFNAQVGIIGHELAHTAYYLNRSFFGILSDALCQFSECRIEFERATDRRLIDYGLGWQRYDHASFVRRRFASNLSSANTTQGGGGAYMSPAELLRIMENHESYAD